MGTDIYVERGGPVDRPLDLRPRTVVKPERGLKHGLERQRAEAEWNVLATGMPLGAVLMFPKTRHRQGLHPRIPGKKQFGHPGHALNVRPTGIVAARGCCVSEVVEREGRAAIVLK